MEYVMPAPIAGELTVIVPPPVQLAAVAEADGAPGVVGAAATGSVLDAVDVPQLFVAVTV